MTSRSSIFSFDTLKLPRSVPIATLFALGLLAAGELGVRAMVATGHLEQDKSLRLTLTSRLDELKADKPPVWFLGNSTLDWGVDVDSLSEQLGVKVVKMAHGSATVDATAAMLDFYIKQSGVKPKQVVVTVTKDDFNPNGFRADKSKTYLEIAQDNELPSADWLMLRAARSNIRDKVTDTVDSLRPGQKAKANAAAIVKPFNGKVLADNDEFVRNLVTKFEVRSSWIGDLKAVCDRHQLPAPILVLMPVTDRYVEYHDRIVKSPTYEQVHQQILAAAKENGVQVIDFWTTSFSDYSLFRDAYHLSPKGKDWLTPQIGQRVKGSMIQPGMR